MLFIWTTCVAYVGTLANYNLDDMPHSAVSKGKCLQAEIYAIDNLTPAHRENKLLRSDRCYIAA